MQTHVYEVVVNTAPEKLWLAIADVRRWPDWDAGLEAIEVEGEVARGSLFRLKPRGGPAVTMSVETMESPRCFVDVAHLPLAKMRTSHEFGAEPGGTRIRLTIQVSGPLGLLWDLLIARKQSKEARGQTEAFVRFAERRS
jgi:ligand-binding SRPBCC domain-containing protein